MDGSEPRWSEVKSEKLDNRPGKMDSFGGGDQIMGEDGLGGGEIAISSGDNPMGDDGIAASREGPACAISTSVCASPAGAIWRDDDE